jgi:hypothetical protein
MLELEHGLIKTVDDMIALLRAVMRASEEIERVWPERKR